MAATLALSGVLLWTTQDDSREAATAAVSSAQSDLARLLQLKEIYSKPPRAEDPSTYPKFQGRKTGKRDPAKIAE